LCHGSIYLVSFIDSLLPPLMPPSPLSPIGDCRNAILRR
jgi:hypothetical protein